MADEERWDSKYILFKNMKLLIYLLLTLWRVKANSIPQLYNSVNLCFIALFFISHQGALWAALSQRAVGVGPEAEVGKSDFS